MSLEQSIADLQTQAGLLLDLPQTIANTAQNQITAVGGAYQNHIDTLSTTFFVDADTGDDNGAGTDASPFKTLQRAIDLTPAGGSCVIWLKSDYYVDEVVRIINRFVAIKGIFEASTDYPKLTFERFSHDFGATTHRAIKNFRMGRGGSLVLFRLEIVIPPLEDPWVSFPSSGFNQVVMSTNGDDVVHVQTTLFLCKVNRPASPFCAFFYGPELNSFYIIAVTENDQPMLGHWLSTVTSPAGTDPGTLPGAHTNLGLV